MQQRTLIGLLVVAVIAGAAWTAQTPVPAASEDGISVYFSPQGGCTDAIVHQIESATKSIRVQAYSCTSEPIAKALRDAHRRGVDVTVVLDASQCTSQYSSATFFFNQGVPAFVDSDHAIAHNKVMLIDGTTIITGSFNFSKAAEENNAENLLVIEGKPALADAYLAHFNQHLAHSAAYRGLDHDAGQGRSAARDDDAAANIEVHVTTSGTKYHRAGCRYLTNSDSTITLKDAKGRGLTPCKVCHPPG